MKTLRPPTSAGRAAQAPDAGPRPRLAGYSLPTGATVTPTVST